MKAAPLSQQSSAELDARGRTEGADRQPVDERAEDQRRQRLEQAQPNLDSRLLTPGWLAGPGAHG